MSGKDFHDGHTRAIGKAGESHERRINGKAKTSFDRSDRGGMFSIDDRLLFGKHCSFGNG